MNWIAAPILLERQYTGSLRIIWVVFDNNTGTNTPDDISRSNTIGGQLIITVFRNADRARLNKL